MTETAARERGLLLELTLGVKLGTARMSREGHGPDVRRPRFE